MPNDVTGDRRRADHPQDDQRQLPAAQAEEDALILTPAAAEPDSEEPLIGAFGAC